MPVQRNNEKATERSSMRMVKTALNRNAHNTQKKHKETCEKQGEEQACAFVLIFFMLLLRILKPQGMDQAAFNFSCHLVKPNFYS